MKKLLVVVALGLTCLIAARADGPKEPAHAAFTPSDLKWGPASPALPPGAQAAVLEGDPTKEGMFTLRVKVPAGYKVAPHRHPALERVTVISGTFHIGMGDTFDETKAKTLPAGSFSIHPSADAHFAWASEETVVQITAMGPWDVLYVNPADDPRKKH